MPLTLFFVSRLQNYTYKLLLTVLFIQATSGTALRWPVTIDDGLDAIFNLKADCWSTFPQRSWVSKPCNFRPHSVYAITCRHCLMYLDFIVVIACPDIFDLAFSGIVHDMVHVFFIPDQAARVCNLCCLQIFSGSGSLVSSALLSPGLPYCQGACCVNSYITSFPAAGKFLTLGLFELSHILFVCTGEKKNKTQEKTMIMCSGLCLQRHFESTAPIYSHGFLSQQIIFFFYFTFNFIFTYFSARRPY